MPSRLRQQGFLPSFIGFASVAIDAQGRIVVPVQLRDSLGGKTPPLDVTFSLTGPGFVTVGPRESSPSQAELAVIKPILDVASRTDPRKLPPDHAKVVRDFFRVLACRYFEGKIIAKWQLSLPAPVRAWLGLGLIGGGAQTKRRTVHGGRQRTQKGELGTALLIGNLGAFEIWNETSFKELVPKQASDFDALATQANTSLQHADRQG